MTLSPKALNALIDIRKSLLADRSVTSLNAAAEKAQAPVPAPPKRERKPTQIMRHARVAAPAWQRYCRRGRRW